jgi:hypothetical protein
MRTEGMKLENNVPLEGNVETLEPLESGNRGLVENKKN